MAIQLLIAEDHPWVRRGLQATFENTGIEIVGEATTGSEAVQLASTADADVMLLDIKLPDCDGFEVLETVKLQNPKMPIVIYTQSERADFQQRARKLGASAYLHKRVDADEIVDTVRRAGKGEKIWHEEVTLVR